MTVSFSQFLSLLAGRPALLITVLLTLGVIFVNGWTDAPNAIATCVSTRAIPVRRAVRMAAVCNFLGVLAMTAWNSEVAMTIYNMVDFGTNTHYAAAALCAALLSIVLWATAAWAFGIPTSESHALIAGLSGAAIALNGNFSGIKLPEWRKVLYGLAVSAIFGFLAGFCCTRLLEKALRHADRRKTTPFFRRAQVAGGAAMAFMHGAQDGQKFMGVFLLGLFLSNGTASGARFRIPIWLMILCSVIMALGTAVGGKKIIRAVGVDMADLTPHRGFAADLGAALVLLFSSLSGIPLSTTHTKTTAIMGAGAAERLSAVNWRKVREMMLAWFFTFPGCGLLGFICARLLLAVL